METGKVPDVMNQNDFFYINYDTEKCIVDK